MCDNFSVDFLPKYRAEIDRTIFEFFAKNKFPEKEFVATIRYATLLGGKRIRPIFGLLAFEISKNSRTKISRKKAIQILLSLELIHAFSLVHDDLPALDDDEFRRSQPTVWRKFGEANAILAGDALIFFAFENLVANSQFTISTKLIAILARASREMTIGQFRDLDSSKNSSRQNILVTHSQKTGALISAAAEFGATLATADTTTTKLLVGFAEKIGLAFQIKDDLLDATGDAKILGKKVGKDFTKKGFVKILGIPRSQKKLNELISAAIIISQKLESNKLKKLAEFIATREN